MWSNSLYAYKFALFNKKLTASFFYVEVKVKPIAYYCKLLHELFAMNQDCRITSSPYYVIVMCINVNGYNGGDFQGIL